mmetsp:Transcript_81895/g.162673  ORF Transcript_81895/g.162673 Transcript_81895/m.162673 type:complete len:106 (+) Transcript_81895:2683-3000(+)
MEGATALRGCKGGTDNQGYFGRYANVYAESDNVVTDIQIGAVDRRADTHGANCFTFCCVEVTIAMMQRQTGEFFHPQAAAKLWHGLVSAHEVARFMKYLCLTPKV